MVLDRLEDIEHAKFRALAQLQVDHEKGIEAFEDYMHRAFPSLEAKKKRKKDKILEALRHEVSKGPIKVTPQPMPKPTKSKLVNRIREVKKGRTSKLYSQLGRVLNK